mgnify:CR=1 FL=1
MRKRGKIKKAERLEIALLRNRGYGVREIGRVLDRSPGSISEELHRNRTQSRYDPLAADHKARIRRMDAKFQGMKIEAEADLKRYVIAQLEAHWNPDEISGRMRENRTPFYASKTAIYDWLRSAYGQRYCPLLYSRRYRRKPRIAKPARVMIPERVSIDARPAGVANRTRFGHWEGDTLVSGKRTGSRAAASVLYERKAKLVLAQRIEDLKPDAHAAAQQEMMQNKKALSLTQDNGIENTRHRELGIPTFFCDPYSSWQKGGVENANKMIRRYIPKGTDLATVSQEYLDQIVSIINGKPRRSLGYRTAIEVATAGGIFLT